VPVIEISLASVVCRAPINPFMAPKPFFEFPLARGYVPPNPPLILLSSAFPALLDKRIS
jgi:hypothetical protein